VPRRRESTLNGIRLLSKDYDEILAQIASSINTRAEG